MAGAVSSFVASNSTGGAPFGVTGAFTIGSALAFVSALWGAIAWRVSRVQRTSKAAGSRDVLVLWGRLSGDPDCARLRQIALHSCMARLVNST